MPDAFDMVRFVELLQLSLLRGLHRSGSRVQQQELAEELGVHAQTVSRWMRGQNRPSEEWVERLRRALDWTDAEVASLYPQAGIAKTEEISFRAWADGIGLDPDFPLLPADPKTVPHGERSSFRPSAFGTSLDELDPRMDLLPRSGRTALLAAYEAMGLPRVAVRTFSGHGGSTASRLLHAMAQESTQLRRAIPVHLSLTDVLGEVTVNELAIQAAKDLKEAHPRFGHAWNVDLEWVRDLADASADSRFGGVSASEVSRHVEHATWAAVVSSLISNKWERTLRPTIVREILGAAEASRDALDRRRAELLAHWVMKTGATMPDLGTPWLQQSSLAALLSEMMPVGLSFIVDLTPAQAGRLYTGEIDGEYLSAPYAQAAATFLTGLSKFKGRLASTAGVHPRSLLVVAPRGLDLSEGDGDWEEMHLPRYRAGDVKGLLGYWYAARDAGTAAFIDALVDGYFQSEPGMSISTALLLMRQRLESQPFSLHRSVTRSPEELERSVDECLDLLAALSPDEQRRVLRVALDRVPAYEPDDDFRSVGFALKPRSPWAWTLHESET